MLNAAMPTNPDSIHCYAPAGQERLLAVWVPLPETSLSEQRYRELLTQRLQGLIQQQVEESGEAATLSLLLDRTWRLGIRYTPPQPQDNWISAWAHLLVWENDLLLTLISQCAISFPVSVEQQPDRSAWLKELFWPPVEPNLEEWLMELSAMQG